MIPKDWKPKKLEEMTLFEAILAGIDKERCGSCSSSFCDEKNWLNSDGNHPSSCGTTRSQIDKVLSEYCGSREVDVALAKLIEENGLLVKLVADEPEEPVEESPKPQPYLYRHTINFMKDKGYSHCYMCGAELRGENE